MKEIARLNLSQLIEQRLPHRKIPKFAVSLIKKIACEDEINTLFASAPGKKNLDFIDACMQYLNIRCQVVGEENLPLGDHKLIFASNHPQGGIEAICIAYILGHKYDSKIKFYANELLSALEPLNELFLPIYKHKMQSKENIRIIHKFYQTDNHLVTFPAGVTSYKHKGKIVDHEWHKNFITAAIQHQRDVVPLYFEARNSNMFYMIENFRKLIRSRINFEVLLFAQELFKQRGNSFTLFVGKPVKWETFDKTKSPKEWATSMQELVFELPQNLSR